MVIDYLCTNHELKQTGDKKWEVRKGEKTLYSIQIEAGKWIFESPSGEQYENPKLEKLNGI